MITWVEARKVYQCSFYYEHPISFTKQRFRKDSPHKSKRASEAWAAEQRVLMTSRAYWETKQAQEVEAQKGKPLTFRELSEEYLTRHGSRLGPSTLTDLDSALRVHLLPALGDLPIDQIDLRQIDLLTAGMLDKLSRKSVKNHLGTLKGVLNKAQEWGYLASVPRFRAPKAPDPDWSFLSQDELKRLLEAAVNDEIRLLILYLAHTGSRFSEASGVIWGDVDLDNRTLKIGRSIVRGVKGSTKSHKVRHVPLTRQLCDALRAFRGEAEDFENVFLHRSGATISNSNTRHYFEASLKAAGLPDHGFHLLRHTYASHLALQGVSLRLIQSLLGHSTIAMTERYAHLQPNSGEAARAALEGFGI